MFGPVAVCVIVLEGVFAGVPEMEGLTLGVFEAVVEGVNVGVPVPVMVVVMDGVGVPDCVFVLV